MAENSHVCTCSVCVCLNELQLRTHTCAHLAHGSMHSRLTVCAHVFPSGLRNEPVITCLGLRTSVSRRVIMGPLHPNSCRAF